MKRESKQRLSQIFQSVQPIIKLVYICGNARLPVGLLKEKAEN